MVNGGVFPMLDSRDDLLLEIKVSFDVDGNRIAGVREQASGQPFATAAIQIVSVLRNLLTRAFRAVTLPIQIEIELPRDHGGHAPQGACVCGK